LTINNAVAVFGLLNGETGVSAVLAGRDDLATAKFGEVTLGEFEAFLNNVVLGSFESQPARRN